MQAWWPSSATFQAPEALYKITGEAGSSTAAVNQQQDYGQWNTLSAGVILDAGAGHKLELPGKASGNYVYADGARFLPSPTLPRNVSWTFTPSSTGTHLVYAKWPAAATHTTEATFTIAHAGGTTDVTVNQRLQGGQWVALGSFTMNASTAYAIALSDNANGQVAADAVRVVPAGASTDKFTWTPTIPSSGSYDVYARWVASSANTGAANYTVTHAGGTATVVVNQKQNGGTWVKLGTYSFAPSSGHKVELAGAFDGRVVADGIRLVSAGAQAANIAYIHADHLGSPQKMTDTAQLVNWDAQFEPFGEEYSITSSATQPNRFPGQYADAETGYSYNYFRDYEPTIGRYIESDPIGLRGGNNTYAYANVSPMMWIDTNGQASIDPDCCDGDKKQQEELNEQIEEACKKAATKVKNKQLRDCILRKCKESTIRCDGDLCWFDYYNPLMEEVAVAYTWEPDRFSIYLCLSYHPDVSEQLHWGCIAIHEYAHNCNWEHEDGGEIPGGGVDSHYSPHECDAFLGRDAKS